MLCSGNIGWYELLSMLYDTYWRLVIPTTYNEAGKELERREW